jgi:WD40 repeat protein
VVLVGSGTPASGIPLVGHEGAVRAVAFADSGVLASAGDDGLINLWDVEAAEVDGAPLNVGARVWAIAFDPAGSRLASVGDDNRMLVWDLDTRAVTHTVQLDGRGYAATWDAEGRTIVVGSSEASLLVWDVEWARREGSVFVAHQDPVRAVAVEPAGWMLISGSPDGSLAVWELTAGNLARVSCEVLGRNMTQAEWDQYGSGEYVRHCHNRPSGDGAPSLADGADYS